MGRFGGVKGAKYSEGGVYFEPGNYMVKIGVVKCQENRKKEEMFLVEVEILSSDNDKLKPGTTCAWVVMSSWDTYLGYIKQFVAAATQIEMSEVDEEGVEMVVSEDNPLKDVIMRVVAVNVPKKDGDPFTKCKWHYPTDEELTAIGYAAA